MFNLFRKGGKTPFRFKASENTACFTCDHVLSRERPILYVSHDGEGDWHFLCGDDDHTEKNARIISLKQATELDQTINDLFEMPLNTGADRKTVKDKWTPFRLVD